MEQSIFEGSREIGTLKCQKSGLFWEFSCKILENREPLCRIYVLNKWKVEYLGIPNASGELCARLPCRHLPEGIDGAVASRHPRGSWLPWRGPVDGVMLEEAYLSADGARMLALPPQEALKLPQWAPAMQTELVFGVQMALLPLTPDGHLPQIETEIGGQNDEKTMEEALVDGASDFDLPADDAAGDGFGGEWPEDGQADRPDL